MKVSHITPTYFDDSSIVGGGERYPCELALWMSKIVDTTLVSFGPQRKSYSQDGLKVEIYPLQFPLGKNKMNAFNLSALGSLLQTDVIHIHGTHTPTGALTALLAFNLKKHVFGISHGGGSAMGAALHNRLAVSKCYRAIFAHSQFTVDHLPSDLNSKAVLVKGGIDCDRFSPTAESLLSIHAAPRTILYVGRILPHKGINYLIEACHLLDCSDFRLKIIGRVYHQEFYEYLQSLGAGLPIEFIHDADDDRLLQEYRSAWVTVLPSVHTTCYGDYTPIPELMGFTLLESQACGTPVICTDAGAMAEFVDNGKTGFVVQQNSGRAIATALNHLLNLSLEERLAFQSRCQEWIRPLSWESVVEQHLNLYQQHL